MIDFKLDLSNLTIEEYTTPCPVTVDQTTSIEDLKNIMEENGIRHIPVVSSNRAVGVISDRDLKPFDALGDFGNKFTAYDIIKFNTPFTVIEGSPLEEVAYAMSEKKIGSAVVTNQNNIVTGIITTTDLMNALVEVLRQVQVNSNADSSETTISQ